MLVDHCTKQKKELSNKKYPELENLQKPIENNVFSMVAIKNIVKHNIFIAFGSQIPLQIMKNLGKTLVFSMVTIKNQCKT